MELRPGYKQTEVGVIPEDWRVAALGELISYTKGFAFKATDYRNSGTRILRVSDTTFDSVTNGDEIYLADIEVEKYKKWRLQEGDLVISTVGSKPPMYDSIVGNAIAINNEHAGCLLNQNAVLIRSKDSREIIQQFIYASLKTKRYLWHIESIFRGNANQASITLDDLFKFQIPLPATSSEQRAIAAALSDVDALMASLDKLIAKKRDIKKAAMQELLREKRRLPGFSGEWHVTSLGRLCDSITDGTHYTPRYVEAGVPFYSVENVSRDDFSNTKFITPEEHTALVRRCRPERGDILLTRIGSLGETKLLDWDVKASIYVSLALLKLRNDVCSEYVYAYTKSRHFITDIESRSLLNASPKKINMKDIGEVPVMLPPTREEQQAIGTILLDMDAQIGSLEARRDKTKLLKQGMMQELLTGRIRLV